MQRRRSLQAEKSAHLVLFCVWRGRRGEKMRVVDCFHALTLAAIALWVSTVAFDVDCNHNASFPLSLNVSVHPLVRILNCSRRVNVNVSCGVDESNPMQLEVINGTTVPQFFLTGCWVNGIQTFAFASITIQGVVMQTKNTSAAIGPMEAIDPLPGSVFFLSGLPLASVAIVILSSKLLWVTAPNGVGAGQLVQFVGSPHQNMNITISNSSLMVWTIAVGGALINFDSPSAHRVRISITGSVVSMTMKHYVGLAICVIEQQYTFATEYYVVVDFSQVSITGDELNSAYYVLRLSPAGSAIGAWTNFMQTVSDTNITVVSGSAFYVMGAPQSYAVVLQDARFTVQRCVVTVTVNIFDRTMELLSSAAFIMISSAILSQNLTMEIASVQMHAMKNTSSLSKAPPSPYTTNSMGAIGLAYNSNSNMSSCNISIVDSTVTVEEVGTHVVAPYSFSGIGVVSVFYSLVLTFGVLLTNNSNVQISNSSIAVRRLVPGDTNAIIYVAPSVQSGIVTWMVSAVALNGPVHLCRVSIERVTVSAASIIYPNADATLVVVWCTVSTLVCVSPATLLVAEFPGLSQLVATIFSSGLNSLELNSSLLRIVDTVTEMTPTSFALQPSPGRSSGALRVVVGQAFFVFAFNTSFVVRNSTIRNISSSLVVDPAYESTVCVSSSIALAPTSYLCNVAVSVQNMTAAAPSSLLCSSGSTVICNTTISLRDCQLSAPIVTTTQQPIIKNYWDTVRLAPTASAFATTMQLDGVIIHLQNTSFSNFRSLFGNVTTPLTRRSAPRNVAIAVSPLQVTVFSCTSNLWDNAPLMKYSNQLLWPTDVDLHGTPNYSLITMSVDTGSAWCSLPRYSATLTRLSSDGKDDYLNLVDLGHQASIATTVVLGVSLVLSSSIGASTLPRLQGIVGAFRLAARCQLSASSSGQSSNDDASSDSSGYVANDVSDNPFLLHFVPVAPSVAYAVGALIGNTLLLLVVGVVSHFLGIAEQRARDSIQYSGSNLKRLFIADGKHMTTTPHTTGCLPSPAVAFVFFTHFLPTTPLPASLMVLYGFLQEPTVGAAVACIASSDTGVAAVVLGTVVGGTWLALPCMFAWHVCVRHSPLPLAAIPTRRVRSTQLRWERVGRMLEWLCSEREEWVAAVGGATRNATARLMKVRFGALFEAFRGGRHWYFAVDVLLGALTGVVIGVAESVDSADACAAAVWGTSCVLAIAALSVVLCVVLRPHVVRCELLVAVCVSALAVVAAGLQLAGEMSASAAVSLAASVLALLPFVAGLAWRACKLEPSAPRHVVGDATSSAKRTRHATSADASVLHVLPSNFLVTPARPAALLAAAQQEEMLRMLLDCICRR